jgi:hypothetical protein
LKGSIMCTLACLTGNRPETAEKMWSIIQWAKLVPPESDPRLLLLSSSSPGHHGDDFLLPQAAAEDGGGFTSGGGGGGGGGGDVPWSVPRALSRVETEHGYYPELIGFLTLLHAVVCHHTRGSGGGGVDPTAAGEVPPLDSRAPHHHFNDETFRPYLHFVVHTVLLQFDERWYEFEAQCWKSVALAMSILAEIVHSYDALKDFSALLHAQPPPPQTDPFSGRYYPAAAAVGPTHQVGYTLVRHLLQESPLLKKLFGSVLGVEFFLGQGETVDVARHGFRFARSASAAAAAAASSSPFRVAEPSSSKVRKGEPRLTDCRQQYPQSTCRLAAIACSHFTATIPSEDTNAQGGMNQHPFSDATVVSFAGGDDDNGGFPYASRHGGGGGAAAALKKKKVETLGTQQTSSIRQALGAWTQSHGRYDGSCASDDEVTWKERAILECMRLLEDLSRKESQFFDLERGMSPQSPVQRLSSLMTAERLSIVAGYVSYEHNLELVLHSVRYIYIYISLSFRFSFLPGYIYVCLSFFVYRCICIYIFSFLLSYR